MIINYKTFILDTIILKIPSETTINATSLLLSTGEYHSSYISMFLTYNTEMRRDFSSLTNWDVIRGVISTWKWKRPTNEIWCNHKQIMNFTYNSRNWLQNKLLQSIKGLPEYQKSKCFLEGQSFCIP